MKSRLLLIALAVFLLCSACGPLNPGLDTGLFSGRPCQAPCFQNLTPGKSTAADVDHFINSLSPKDWPANRSLVYSSDCKDIFIADRVGTEINRGVYFTVSDGKLTFIRSLPGSWFTLGQLADHLGPPQYFTADLAIGPDGDFYWVEVYYPSRGLAFVVHASQNAVSHMDQMSQQDAIATGATTGYVTRDMPVDEVQYFEPATLLAYFVARRSCDFGQNKATDIARTDAALTQPWSGFGAVKVTTSR